MRSKAMSDKRILRGKEKAKHKKGGGETEELSIKSQRKVTSSQQKSPSKVPTNIQCLLLTNQRRSLHLLARHHLSLRHCSVLPFFAVWHQKSHTLPPFSIFCVVYFTAAVIVVIVDDVVVVRTFSFGRPFRTETFLSQTVHQIRHYSAERPPKVAVENAVNDLFEKRKFKR